MSKKTININVPLSYAALVILAGLAYEGLLSLLDSKPSIETGFAILLVMLLVKQACRK